MDEDGKRRMRPRTTPKRYPNGTGYVGTEELTDDKVVRTVNVNGLVWMAGKKSAGARQQSISYVVEQLLAGLNAGLIDLDEVIAELAKRERVDGGVQGASPKG